MSLEVLLNERHLLSRKIFEIDQEIWEILKKYRTKLSPREYQIIKMRLYNKMTLEKVAQEFGITRERIRQLEMKIVMIVDDLIATGISSKD